MITHEIDPQAAVRMCIMEQDRPYSSLLTY